MESASELTKVLQVMQQQMQFQEQLAAKQLQLQEQQAARLEQQQKALFEALQSVSRAISERTPPPFPPFQPDKEKWTDYVDSLEQHWVCNNVMGEDKKRAAFLSNVGCNTTSLLRKLFAGQEVAKLDWKEIREALDKHYIKKPHIVAARYSFFQKRKKENQTHGDWIAELNGLAQKCEFKCASEECGRSYAESLIRDMVILHTPEEKIRLEALRNTNPALEEVQRIAATYEATRENARHIAGDGQVCEIKRPYGRREHCSSESDSVCSEVRDKERRPSTDNSRGSRREKAKDNYDSGSDDAARADKDRFGQRRRGFISESVSKSWKSCRNCNKFHSRQNCRFRNAECFLCGKVGHIKEVCRSGRKSEKQSRNGKHEEMEIDTVNRVLNDKGQNRLLANIQIGKQEVQFLIDTGATVTLINLDTYKRLGAPAVSKVEKAIVGFGRNPIKVIGKFETVASYKGRKAKINLIVVDRYDVTNVLGLDSFSAMGFGVVDQVNAVSENEELSLLEGLKQEFSEVFEPGLGEFKNFQAKLVLKEKHKPKFCKARSVPWAIRSSVDEEIRRLEQEKIITSVTTSEWATPLVIVRKANGGIRLCGDFKSTVNQQIEIEQYPIPKPEDLFQKLAGGQQFTKIDLKDAYLQVPLDEEARKVLVVNTPLGLYQFNRLPFGVASAAAIFQRALEKLTIQVPGCINYLDDIIVTGRSREEHIRNLRELLSLLRDNGLRVNWQKCDFLESKWFF